MECFCFGFYNAFLSKFINKFATMICLSIFCVHKYCFHFEIVLIKLLETVSVNYLERYRKMQ